jgi:flagellar protein FlbD
VNQGRYAVIVVTRLNGGQIGVNPDLVQRIDSAPDTILTLIDGTKYIVTESLPEVIDRINEHRATILARAREIQASPHIGLVPDLEDDDAQAPIAPAVPLRPRSV